MNMTQRGQLAPEDEEALKLTMCEWERAEAIRAAVREVVVTAIEQSSYREVARLTGLSTNTLQRWKRHHSIEAAGES